jgi:hypothetical protein
MHCEVRFVERNRRICRDSDYNHEKKALTTMSKSGVKRADSPAQLVDARIAAIGGDARAGPRAHHSSRPRHGRVGEKAKAVERDARRFPMLSALSAYRKSSGGPPARW